MTNDAAPASSRRRTVPWDAVAIGIGATLSAALIAVTVLLLVRHTAAADERHRTAEYAAAARQSVVNLMAINHETAKESVQRVLEGSTGTFRDNFEASSQEFVEALQAEKITTTATVNDAAVESITGDSAVVMVSATSQRQDPKAPKAQQEPRVWRVVVTLQREGDAIKMSSVEFV